MQTNFYHGINYNSLTFAYFYTFWENVTQLHLHVIFIYCYEVTETNQPLTIHVLNTVSGHANSTLWDV